MSKLTAEELEALSGHLHYVLVQLENRPVTSSLLRRVDAEVKTWLSYVHGCDYHNVKITAEPLGTIGVVMDEECRK